MTYEDFILAADEKDFMMDLHQYMLANQCKVKFEEKKTSLLGSYKYKTKSVINVLQKKQGLLVRIYGENIGSYPAFLHTLPAPMVAHLETAGECKRITQNTCSPKCTGYDFMVNDQHFQKCRYNCFEFLVTDVTRPFIRQFVENELGARVSNE